MCLVVAAVDASKYYSLILCANRDERHARPTAPAQWWDESPHVFGGRDLVAGGTWLALNRRARLAAVTNYRTLDPAVAPRSRGELVARYVMGDLPLEAYRAAVIAEASSYGPFSLLLLEGMDVRYVSNRAPPKRLGRGVHALSNAAYGVEWPKVVSARAGVVKLLDVSNPFEPLFQLLAQRGKGRQEERYRNAHFITGELYGTRSSTVVLVTRDGLTMFAERSFDAAGRVTGEVRESFVTEPAR